MAGRVLELRVHGVSNTPPAVVLGVATGPGNPPPDHDSCPRLVAGDTTTGFYRPSRTDPTEPVTVEAYSWGQLTSGVRAAKDIRRALWTLLLPFTLANVALYARPEIPADPGRERLTTRAGLNAWLVRLFCLSLTATLILSATGVGVDLIAWQCVDEDCLRQLPGPWEFLGTGWWSEAAHPLAIGLLLPLGVLAVIGVLTWRTYQYEAEMPTGPAEANGETQPDHPLREPSFWCGEGQVRRLATVHLTVGAAVAAVVPLGAVITMDPPQGPRAVLTWSVLALLGVTILLAMAALAHPYLTSRNAWTALGPYGSLLWGLAALGVVGTAVVLLLPDGPAGVPLRDLRPPDGCIRDSGIPGCVEDRSLPGYDWVLAWLGTFQVLLLIAIAGVSRTGRRALVPSVVAALAIPVGNAWIAGWLPGVPPAPDGVHAWMVAGAAVAVASVGTPLLPRTTSRTPGDPHSSTAWGGRGPALLAGLAWLLGISYSSGVLYLVTARLNNGDTPSGLSTITPPVPVLWGGPAFVVMLLTTSVMAGHAWLVLDRLRRHNLDRLVPADSTLSAHERRRAWDVATYQALHEFVGDRVPTCPRHQHSRRHLERDGLDDPP